MTITDREMDLYIESRELCVGMFCLKHGIGPMEANRLLHTAVMERGLRSLYERVEAIERYLESL